MLKFSFFLLGFLFSINLNAQLILKQSNEYQIVSYFFTDSSLIKYNTPVYKNEIIVTDDDVVFDTIFKKFLILEYSCGCLCNSNFIIDMENNSYQDFSSVLQIDYNKEYIFISKFLKRANFVFVYDFSGNYLVHCKIDIAINILNTSVLTFENGFVEIEWSDYVVEYSDKYKPNTTSKFKIE